MSCQSPRSTARSIGTRSSDTQTGGEGPLGNAQSGSRSRSLKHTIRSLLLHVELNPLDSSGALKAESWRLIQETEVLNRLRKISEAAFLPNVSVETFRRVGEGREAEGCKAAFRSHQYLRVRGSQGSARNEQVVATTIPVVGAIEPLLVPWRGMRAPDMDALLCQRSPRYSKLALVQS